MGETEQYTNKFCGMRRLCVIFGKWQGAQYWSKGVCMLVGVGRSG